MSVTYHSKDDIRVLVVRGREIKRTDSGVWFALSLALIFVVVLQRYQADLSMHGLHTSAPLSTRNLAI